LRQICDKYGILLIFDEVISGFGRLGHAFASERYGVIPDFICFAKGVTSGTVPMGGVIARKGIYDAFMKGPEHVIELFHGYTYSAHPLAVAAGLATLDVMADEKLIERAAMLAPVLEKAMHSLRGEPHVIDIRNVGLAAAIELSPVAGAPGMKAIKVFEAALNEGQMVRFTGDILAVAPPFISTVAEVEEMVEGIRRALRAVPV